MQNSIDEVDLIALLPLLVLGAGAVAQLLLAAIRRGGADALAVITHLVAFATLPFAATRAPVAVTPMVEVDAFGLTGVGLLIVASLAVTSFARGWLTESGQPREEFHALVAIATTGAATLAVSTHLATLLLGIEVLGVALYGLIGFDRRGTLSTEAALKYLIPAGAASAVTFLGVAFVYAATGGLSYADVAVGVEPPLGTATLGAAGLALIVVGVGFKLALVPFHLWTPDVYQGAPPPVTAFVASVSKGGVALALIRIAHREDTAVPTLMVGMLGLLALVSMVVGNLLALRQERLERLLAYSSIAHLGYLVVALLGDGERGVEAATVYLAAYAFTVVSAFGLLGVLRTEDEGTPLSSCRGLWWRRPWVAAAFALCLLSLAGMPLTAGFTAKVFALRSAVDTTRWVLALTLALSSVLGMYYYLRVIFALVATDELPTGTPHRPSGWSVPITVVALLLLIVWFGTWPAPVLEFVGRAVR